MHTNLDQLAYYLEHQLLLACVEKQKVLSQTQPILERLAPLLRQCQ